MDKDFEILNGDALKMLKTLPDKSVYTCVTSPPYYGLRDYGTGKWIGGDDTCDHIADKSATKKFGNVEFNEHRPSREETLTKGYYKAVCPKCGAVRVDSQIGLEETPQEYIQNLVDVFTEVMRVLKDDGTLWINIGDSYSGNCSVASNGGRAGMGTPRESVTNRIPMSCKPKDLIGIPWMLAFALRESGWYLRQDIIWAKSNPMPESVKDRCTKSHEYIFLLSKSNKYYYDYESIQEDTTTNEHRPSGIERERELGYNSKRNNNPEAYLLGNDKRNTKSKYSNVEEEAKYRQGMHKNRGSGIVEKRYYLPDKELLIQYLKNNVTIDDIVSTGVTKTTAEHWYRHDDGFSYPKVEDWKMCRHLFDDSTDEFKIIDEGLLTIDYEDDGFYKTSRHFGGGKQTRIKFGGNKYGDSNDLHFQTYSGNNYIYKGKRNKRDVWTVGVNTSHINHFATYPEELIEPCVLAGCPEGGVVLDPFSGTATTGVVALKHNRKYIGCELSEEYAQLSIDRLTDIDAKENLW